MCTLETPIYKTVVYNNLLQVMFTIWWPTAIRNKKRFDKQILKLQRQLINVLKGFKQHILDAHGLRETENYYELL